MAAIWEILEVFVALKASGTEGIYLCRWTHDVVGIYKKV